MSDSSWAPAERATGISRDEWLEFLIPHAELAHPDLAKLVLERIPADVDINREWWAQSVTVLFEQHLGRRAVNQRCDGTFAASASKTIPGERADVAAAWSAWVSPETANMPLVLDGPPRESATEKWHYWRATTAEGAAVSVNMNSRAAGKTTLAVDVKNLSSAEQSAEYKTLFKELFAEFAASLT